MLFRDRGMQACNKVHTGFWWGNLRERGHLEYPDIDGRIILRWIIRKWVGGMDWIDLAQYREMWRALVNAVVKLRAPQSAENFRSSCQPASCCKKVAAPQSRLGKLPLNAFEVLSGSAHAVLKITEISSTVNHYIRNQSREENNEMLQREQDAAT